MELPKKYLHDKPVLALLTANLFFTILVTVSVLLRLGSNSGEGFIIQYRENLGLNAFTAGSILDMLSFVLFAIASLVLAVALSIRTYELKRQLAVFILSGSALILILTLIVSNALLVLQ